MVETISNAAPPAEGSSASQQQWQQPEPVNDPRHDNDGMPSPPEDRNSTVAWQPYERQMVRYMAHIANEHRAEMASVQGQRDQALRQLEQATQATTQAVAQAAAQAAVSRTAAGGLPIPFLYSYFFSTICFFLAIRPFR